ncbi:MAG TPA: outer membrane protein transport protein, partial [Gemmatimonadota bacterium]|nr:outer membrane protein transport protein [Gemmatimonadota bacterium]
MRPRAAALLVLFAAPAPAAGQAWLKWDVAARPMGMGGAAAALDDAASAAWYDPAGISTLVGTRVSVGGAVSLRSGEVEAVGLGEFDRETEALTDGYLHVVHPLTADLTGGLSVVSPWEIATTWNDPESFPGRFQAFHTRLRSLDVSPVLAWRVRPHLAVAGGVHVASARLELGRFEQDPDLSALGGLEPIALARSDLEVDGTGIGWVAGVHWRPIPSMALAAHARGPVGLDLSGVVDFTGTAPASLRDFSLPTGEETIGDLLDTTYVDQTVRTRIELPALAAAGVAWDPFDRVRLAATLQWAGWEAVDDLELAFADTSLADAIPLDYENAWSLRLGAEVRHSSALF